MFFLKSTKKYLKNIYKQSEQEKDQQTMPITSEELNHLLYAVDESSEGGCDKTLLHTKLFLETHHLKHKTEIINWLIENGGGCDCEVISNVADNYAFLLDGLENSYTNYKDEEEYEEEILNSDSLNPIRYRPSNFDLVKEDKIFLENGLEINTFPKPWTLWSFKKKSPKAYTACYGKNKGINSSFCAYFFQFPLPFPKKDKYFIESWKEINSDSYRYTKVSEKFLISRSSREIGRKICQEVTVENELALRKTIWIFDPQNPNWYILIANTPMSITTEKREFDAILKSSIY